ncbi:AbrB/MazE/SpoVT family DNA-binding domain-containing protein [Stygiolobus caldivivus]|uniref:AbrB family transcriptional regulator n=1 Tax=Stygiolobus caldivivus TaxID=2824673 RepID=A0A8D5U6A1_9CREN|nr:phosphate uptake regulator PhoU [Stygiolobus caldivivus]BCU69624.1 AbrB family transcriptional regulator [Stygiolobus caldivivus]
MSVRRLQKIKGGSYIISLPTEWVRKNGLEVKSELKVYETPDGLKVKPIKSPNAEREVVIDDLDTALYLISVYYMQGISKIVVKSKNTMTPEVKKALKELQLTHPGLEVVDESFNSLTFSVNYTVNRDLKALTKGYVEKIKKILDDLLSVIDGLTPELKEDLVFRCDSLIKDYRGIIRNIAIGVQLDDEYNFEIPYKDIILYAIFMRDLGRFVSHLKQFISLLDKDIQKEPIKKVAEMFVRSTEMFFDENLDGIKWLRESMDDLESRCNSSEPCKELIRMASYCIAVMDDAVHKSVRLI